MAQTNYTPILLYASGTATNVPLAANLTSSAPGAELAINYADGKLFYKDSGGVVQVLATKSTALSTVTNNGVVYVNSSGQATSGSALVFDGTNFGLGVTPSAWNSSYRAFQFAARGVLANDSTDAGVISFGSNYYRDSGTNYVYLNSSFATRYTQYAGQHQWYTAAAGTAGSAFTFTQTMTLDANGNLGVGTTSPSALLDVWGSGKSILVGGTASSNIPAQLSTTLYLSGAYDASNKRSYRMYVDGNGALNFDTTGSYAYANLPSSGTYANKMTLDTSGNLLVGNTANTATSYGIGFQPNGGGSGTPLIYCAGSASTNAASSYFLYSTGAGAYRFYVDYGGTIHATSIVITAISDQRLKENVRDLDTGLPSIMALKPRRFDWKEGKGQDKKDAAGFIAQEFENVFPECVSTSKAGADGIEYKNINYETLMPTLVKAIQELAAQVTTLQTQVTALKA